MENKELETLPYEKVFYIGDHVFFKSWENGPVYVIYELKAKYTGVLYYRIHQLDDKNHETILDTEDDDVAILYGPFRPRGWKADQHIKLGDRVRVTEGFYAARAIEFPVGTEGVVREIREPDEKQDGFTMYMVSVPTPFDDGEAIWGDPDTEELDRKSLATGYYNDELDLVSRFDLSGKKLIKLLEEKLPETMCIRLTHSVTFNGDDKHTIQLSTFAGLHAHHVAAICKWGRIYFEGYNFSIAYDLANQVFIAREKEIVKDERPLSFI